MNDNLDVIWVWFYVVETAKISKVKLEISKVSIVISYRIQRIAFIFGFFHNQTIYSAVDFTRSLGYKYYLTCLKSLSSI